MRGTALRAGLVLATAATLGLAGASATAATKSRGQSAKGDVTAGPTSLVFSAKRAAGAPADRATGFFTGRVLVAGTQVIRFAGPITCLDVQGDSVGFFYPITDSDPEAVEMLGAGVFINITTDGAGQATGLSFVPSPTSTTTDCAPMPAPVPASGPVTLRS